MSMSRALGSAARFAGHARPFLRSMSSIASETTASSSTPPPRFARIALLEQQSVLFPGTEASLDFCEPRHLLMLAKVLKDQRPAVGVVSLKSKRKPVADASSPASSRLDLITDWSGENVGTEAVLPPLHLNPQSPEQLTFKLSCHGTRRFKILHQERTLEGAYEAEVEFFEDENTPSAAAATETSLNKAEKAHTLLLQLLDLPYDGPADVPMALPAHLNDLKAALDAKDVTAFSYKLAALIPAPREERQALLSSPNVDARLDKAINTLTNLTRKYSEPPAPTAAAAAGEAQK